MTNITENIQIFPKKEEDINKSLDLIESIRINLQKIVHHKMLWGGKLSDGKVSELLGQARNHI